MGITVKASDSEAEKSIEEQELAAQEAENLRQKNIEQARSESNNDDEDSNSIVFKSPSNKKTDNNDEPGGEGDDRDGLTDDLVLKYLQKSHNTEVASIEDLLKPKTIEVEKIVEKEVELPDDVKKFYDYKKDTGRGLEDFIKVQTDLDSVDENELLVNYLQDSEEGITREDANFLMNDYAQDEDLDESENRRRSIRKKRAVSEAKSFYKSQQEKYRTSLEPSGGSLTEEQKETMQAYNDMIAEQEAQKEKLQIKRQSFGTKTKDLFNGEFDGFEFKVGEEDSFKFKTGGSEDMKSSNSFKSFLDKHTDDDGNLQDPVGYHKGLMAALDPDKLAEHFFKKGYDKGVGEFSGLKNPKTKPNEARTEGFIGKTRVSAEKSDNSGNGLTFK